MAASPEDEAARRAYYQCLADTELLLLLAEEPHGDNLKPEVFDLTDGRFALVFDTAERLAEFGGGRVVPFAELTGRILADMLRGRNIGMVLNPGVAPSEFMMSPDAVNWMNQALGAAPSEVSRRVTAILGASTLPDPVCDLIAAKLETAAGLVGQAWLASASYDSGEEGQLLGFVDAYDDARAALGQAAAEALAFSGMDGAGIEVGFFRAGTPIAEQLSASARPVPLSLPAEEPRTAKRQAPGSDPERPPILK